MAVIILIKKKWPLHNIEKVPHKKKIRKQKTKFNYNLTTQKESL